MDLLPDLRREGYEVQEVRVVNRNGKRVSGFPVSAFARAMRGRYVSLPRGELAALIFRKIESTVETIFGDTVTQIQQSEHAVHVTFASGVVRDFDLVAGADGLHSGIRQIVFGPEGQFEKYLGYKAAAFGINHYRPRDELVYMMYTQVGQQVARFAMRDDRTMILFTFADENVGSGYAGAQAPKMLLRERFGDSGWECPQILDALDASEDLYFDRVSQIQMDPNQGLWSRGRVTLVGDAASCVSLLAGQGSALAMVAAYILAGELHHSDGDYQRAFARYQQLFYPLVVRKQKSALRFAGTFAPKSRTSLFIRNQVMKTLANPWIANLVVGRDLADDIALPNYDA